MVKFMIVGCLHGELDKMYADVAQTENKYNIKVDVILCCGDFQSVRNKSDLSVMSVPPKFRRLGDFWRYYSGDKEAPYLTIFIGGNHEASNYLQELPYGGWVAPKIYYLGYAGVINYRGIRIGGLSGIYKRHDYYSGHFEHAPYDDQTKRTAYHIRNIDVFRLMQINCKVTPLDIVLSHDWPRGIHKYGNYTKLIQQKPHFKDEIESNELGNPVSEELLCKLQPKYWLSAHLHVKFAGCVKFNETNRVTKFLALDKCLPYKDYMQFIEIDGPENCSDDNNFYLDPEWLCILKSTNHLMTLSRTISIMPIQADGETRCDFSATPDDIEKLKELFGYQLKIPNNFEQTAPIHSECQDDSCNEIYTNIQTDLLCAMLDLVNPNAEFTGLDSDLVKLSAKLKERHPQSQTNGEEEEEVDDNDEDDSCYQDEDKNPDEIVLEDCSSDEEEDGEAKLASDQPVQDKPTHKQNEEEYNPMDYAIPYLEQPVYCPDEPDL